MYSKSSIDLNVFLNLDFSKKFVMTESSFISVAIKTQFCKICAHIGERKLNYKSCYSYTMSMNRDSGIYRCYLIKFHYSKVFLFAEHGISKSLRCFAFQIFICSHFNFKTSAVSKTGRILCFGRLRATYHLVHRVAVTHHISNERLRV